MDIINRLVQFPSMFKSIDLKDLFNQLTIYPFFNFIYILQSLKYQSDLIEQDQEYYPPVLCNDSIYTWYRMGMISQQEKARVLDEKLIEKEIEDVRSTLLNIDRPDNVIDINYKERKKQVQDAPDIVADEKTKIPLSDKKLSANLRIISNSLYYKSSSFKFVNQVIPKVDEEEIELSGFSKFLRSKTLNKKSGGNNTYSHDDRSVGDEETDIEVSSEQLNSSETTEEQPFKKKKKKEKKHKKKELVNQLVEQSLYDNELLVSEPFAELLYAQGYKDKAIKIYEKLMDKNPEKRLNFAAKIDKINKESF